MDLLDHNAEGVTIHFEARELMVVMNLVQEGRLGHNLKEPTGQAIDELLRTAAALVNADRRAESRIHRHH